MVSAIRSSASSSHPRGRSHGLSDLIQESVATALQSAAAELTSAFSGFEQRLALLIGGDGFRHRLSEEGEFVEYRSHRPSPCSDGGVRAPSPRLDFPQFDNGGSSARRGMATFAPQLDRTAVLPSAVDASILECVSKVETSIVAVPSVFVAPECTDQIAHQVFDEMPSSDEGLNFVNDLSSHLPINDKGGGCNARQFFGSEISEGQHNLVSDGEFMGIDYCLDDKKIEVGLANLDKCVQELRYAADFECNAGSREEFVLQSLAEMVKSRVIVDHEHLGVRDKGGGGHMRSLYRKDFVKLGGPLVDVHAVVLDLPAMLCISRSVKSTCHDRNLHGRRAPAFVNGTMQKKERPKMSEGFARIPCCQDESDVQFAVDAYSGLDPLDTLPIGCFGPKNPLCFQLSLVDLTSSHQPDGKVGRGSEFQKGYHWAIRDKGGTVLHLEIEKLLSPIPNSEFDQLDSMILAASISFCVEVNWLLLFGDHIASFDVGGNLLIWASNGIDANLAHSTQGAGTVLSFSTDGQPLLASGVTMCSLATVSLDLLREPKGCYDVVLNDVHMSDMDGFKLLEHVGLELDLPVIMMSADGRTTAVMKGISHGFKLLVVGCSNGEITLWEVGLQQWLGLKPFKVWGMTSCSMPFQAAFVKDSSMSVSCVSWSPDGNLIGIELTKHLVQLYAYQGSAELRQHLEIDAHAGCVNDLAFSHPNKQLCVVACGDDKLIKIWDLFGKKLFNFEGHEAPVYNICPHQKENIQFIFATTVDGKIKVWLYDNIRSRVNYDAPGQWCTTMLYSDEENRLFFCGTSKDGESFLVEWNESEGAIKRTYYGFRKKSAGIVQFDTMRNHFLADSKDNRIKFWDIVDEVEFSMKSGLNKKPGLRLVILATTCMIMVTAFEVYADSHKKRKHRCGTCGKVFGSPTQHNYSYKVTLRTRCFFKGGIMIRYQITGG